MASVTVDVAPTAQLAASPTTISAGGSATLTWSSTNATSCTAVGGWSGALAASGTRSTGALSAGRLYSLSCNGTGGASALVSVTVDVKPTVTLTAKPSVVPVGNSAVLTWTASNANYCSASGGWSGNKATSGSFSSAALSANTTFSLVCTGPGGSSDRASVAVLSGPVNITPATAAMTSAQTQQFTATFPGGGVATWAVDGVTGGNAAVGRISSTGVYTPGSAFGRHAIAAASATYPALVGSAAVALTDLAGVFTYHNDLARDGVNAQEYALTTSNVAPGSFGKLFSCPVDGAIYGQPLWVANLTIAASAHNVVVVATEHDGLFAFDADASPCVRLWSANLIDTSHGAMSGESTVPSGVTGYLVGKGEGDIMPEVGVTGTPVIDPVTETLYVVSKSLNPAQGLIYQRLHAIDLTTGNERAGSPVIIAGTFPGSGDGGATVTFVAAPENQRAGLALVNGVVYVAWAAHEDAAPWYGWIMGYVYNGSTLAQTAVFNVAPNTQNGGIWMGGGAPASDANGNLFLVTGNAGFDATSSSAPNNDYGDSLLQLTGGLSVSQYFTPSDQQTDSGGDNDFGAGGAAVLAELPAGSPVRHLLVCGGKDGSLYVLNRDVLGGYGDAAAVQKIILNTRIYATGAFWNSNFYLAGSKGPLTSYQLDPSIPQLTSSAATSHIYGFPGGTPSISAAAAENGIVWTLDNSQYCTSLAPGCGPAVLFAHDASNVAAQLWTSAGSPADAAGNAVKFAVPTIANGKVYVGTRGNNAGGLAGSSTTAGELDVYGLH